jgi:hypothetical protein
MTTELLHLQQTIADSAARSDIECMCIRETIAGEDWYTTDSCDAGDREDLLIAVRYLALRGLLEKHPSNSRMVRLVEEFTLTAPVLVTSELEGEGAHD